MKNVRYQIDNYVRTPYGIVKINGVTRKKIGYCPKPSYERYVSLNDVSPIELTKDIISVLFEASEILGETSYYSEDRRICLYPAEYSNRKDSLVGVHFDNIDMDSLCHGDVRYLHELQNLIWSADPDYKFTFDISRIK